ncbi:MAG: DinB family protein [Pirellulaceae bacterium]
MSVKAHAQHGLNMSRQMLENILAQFDGDDWYFQPEPKANHALWVVGHLALADNAFASKFREDTANKPDGYEELFWFGTEPTSDPSTYPPVDEVVAYFRERRENLLNVLDQLSDEELTAEAPAADEGGPVAGAPDVGQLFHFASWHEGIHTGQVTVCHRGLGHPPLYRPENVPATADGA